MDKECQKSFFKKILDKKKAWNSKFFWKTLLLGQFLSLLICGTALTSGLLQEVNVNIPTGQSLLNYVLLVLIYNPIVWFKFGFTRYKEGVTSYGWVYLLLGVVEVEANFLIVKAYQYTSVTSVQLLDCLIIPVVMILSKCFLKSFFVWQNYLGVGVCLAGAGLLIYADFITGRSHSQTHSTLSNVIGDVLCMLGAILYGILNVAEEFLVSKQSPFEYLAMISLPASIVSIIQFVLLERKELCSIDFTSPSVYLPLGGFVLSMFLFYSFLSHIIRLSSTMSVNLSLLTSDFFSLFVGIFVFNYKTSLNTQVPLTHKSFTETNLSSNKKNFKFKKKNIVEHF